MNAPDRSGRSHSAALIAFVTALAWDRIAASTRRAAVNAVLDTVGCGLFGAQFPWGRIAAEVALEDSGGGPASVWGTGQAASPSRAALANATASHGFELDDVAPGALVHPGAVVVPAAIAAAETVGATGERLVLGIIAGYEMMERLGFALGHAHNNRGYHTTGVAGPIAACVAAAIVAGADESVVARGIGIACSSASGIKAFTDGSGGMVKRLHAGHAAEQGVLAWQLASRGFTGPLQAIDGRYGLLEVIGGTGAHPAALDARLGETWAVDHVWVKTFPCCGLIHTTAQAVSEIRDAEKLDAAEVESVRLGLGQRAVDQNGATDPQDPMAAQYSIPYCAAVALTGDVRDPRSFLGAALEDPAPRAMIQRITLYVDDEVERHFPGRFGVKAELRTRDGRRFGKTLWYARGTPFDACSEDDIVAKFRRLAGAVAAPEAVSAVERAIVAIAEAKDVTGLSAALRAATLADARS